MRAACGYHTGGNADRCGNEEGTGNLEGKVQQSAHGMLHGGKGTHTGRRKRK